MCYEVIQNITYAPKEDRKLIYIIKACTPYVSVDCAFQIFTSVSQEFLKGIKIGMINTFWISTVYTSYFLFFTETCRIQQPPWCPVVDAFSVELFNISLDG